MEIPVILSLAALVISIFMASYMVYKLVTRNKSIMQKETQKENNYIIRTKFKMKELL
jgi:hypothetical protein